ncbi:MAG: aminotransferase class I/II-fold pyridoxal phosphate-dependent enzyme [Blautia sp.]|nr:aminotransferase class I/II-fold pyridoxal phosphate-dependent enzyme [Blautia sp.]
MERLYKELRNYSQTDYYPFHMPGHKRNISSVDDKFPFEMDITEINGFDNLHHAEGIIKRAQKNMAQLYGVQETFFSINGSTAALQAAISASVKRGGQILMARNCHKAVYNTLYLRNLQPTYVYPHREEKLGINGGISAARVERYLEENPEIQAVLITSPTYDGIVSDIRRIADAAHANGIPLIVDEAHGAHFHFSGYFPASAAELGADLVIQSLHKTLPSMTQTAVLHRCTDRVDRDLICRFMGIYQTSSPSYVFMASMDACADKLARDGEKMFREYTKNLQEARERLKKCTHIRLITPQKGKDLRIYDYDRSKLIFSTENSSLNGKQLHEILNREFHLELEMSAENYALALTSVGDTKEGFLRLCEAIETIDNRESLKNTGRRLCSSGENQCPIGEMKQFMSISDAMDADFISCILEESVGKISAEFAYLYPPGIPILVPGEQITGLFVRNVRRYMEQGLELQGLRDSSNETICVVKE